MQIWFLEFLQAFWGTLRDVLPIAAVLFGFQFLVIRKPLPNFRKVIIGFFYVLLGLTFFLKGLEQALFPLGRLMAEQLTDPSFIYQGLSEIPNITHWSDYYWVLIFAFAIGFSTAIAEPSLMVVAIKASQVSGGAVSIWGLRITVAIGVAIGISLGSWRIITGYPLHYFIAAGYAIVIIQTLVSPKMIIALAYDSGGVSTSTVTVPLVAALGLGLAETVPGRNVLTDGFGLIAFACLFPIMSVLAYAKLSEYKNQRARNQRSCDDEKDDKLSTSSSVRRTKHAL